MLIMGIGRVTSVGSMIVLSGVRSKRIMYSLLCSILLGSSDVIGERYYKIKIGIVFKYVDMVIKYW